MNLRQLTRQVNYAGSHHRHLLAVGGAAAILAVFWAFCPPIERVLLGWDAYALMLLGLAWARIATASPAVVIRVAPTQHLPRVLLLLFILLAACSSFAAVASLLLSKRGGQHMDGALFFAVATVALSWLLVHTTFTLHYAYLYYRLPNSRRIAPKPAGLQFPGHGEPDYLDFAYFSFVIGMTSQVSDVQIASREIRRWALLHGAVAFGFNTAILALSINVISGLF